MFKSKHSGWTWDLKRTPFGGGGGIGNAFGLGDALASIDPGPAIGSGLASVDKAVNQIPGGWITVGALTAGGLALAYAPEVMALAASEGITPEAAAIATGTAPIDVATGATVPLDTLGADVFSGLSANAPVDASLSQAAAGGAAGETVGAASGGGSFVPTAGNSFVIDPTATYTTASGASGGIAGGGSAAGIVSNPVTPEMIAAANASSDPIGMMSYLTNATPEELAAATGPGAGASSDLASALKTANQVRQVAGTANSLSKLLTQGAGSGLSNSLGQLAKGANSQGQALTSLVRGNTNPFAFTAQQPIRNATTPDLASLASLLKQG